jgi:hypothetical protein
VLTEARVVDILETPLDILFQEKKFRYIVFADVLEHLSDPVGVLRAAEKVLSQDGEILISIPNVAHASVRLGLLAGRFDYSNEGLLDRTHAFFYTRKSLFEMLERAGLAPLDLDRTYLGALDGDIPLLLGGIVTKELIDAVEKEDEATTYQFIARAYPANRRQNNRSWADFDNSQQKAAHDRSRIPSCSHESWSGRFAAEWVEVQIANLRGDIIRRFQDQEMRVQGSEYATSDRLVRVETMVTTLWNMLPIRLWRKFRGIR